MNSRLRVEKQTTVIYSFKQHAASQTLLLFLLLHHALWMSSVNKKPQQCISDAYSLLSLHTLWQDHTRNPLTVSVILVLLITSSLPKAFNQSLLSICIQQIALKFSVLNHLQGTTLVLFVLIIYPYEQYFMSFPVVLNLTDFVGQGLLGCHCVSFPKYD